MFRLHPAKTQSTLSFPSCKQQLLALPNRDYCLPIPIILPEAQLQLLHQNHTSPNALINIKHPSIKTSLLFVLHCHWLQLTYCFPSITRDFKSRPMPCVRHPTSSNHAGALTKRRGVMDFLLHQLSKALERFPKARRSENKLMHFYNSNPARVVPIEQEVERSYKHRKGVGSKP